MIPKNRKPTHPGEILRLEFMMPLGISQTALAKRLGWTQPKVNDIVNERRGITPQTAIVLGMAFCTTPEFWLNLQTACDLWEAKNEQYKHVVAFDLKAASKPRHR